MMKWYCRTKKRGILYLYKWYLSNASCEEEYDKEEVWLDGLNEDEKQKAIVDSW